VIRSQNRCANTSTKKIFLRPVSLCQCNNHNTTGPTAASLHLQTTMSTRADIVWAFDGGCVLRVTVFVLFVPCVVSMTYFSSSSSALQCVRGGPDSTVGLVCSHFPLISSPGAPQCFRWGPDQASRRSPTYGCDCRMKLPLRRPR